MARGCYAGWVCVVMLSFAVYVGAQNADWTTPIAPFKVADNVYYVGSKDLASYLIVTTEGDILINSNLVSSPALIRKSVEQLGFNFHRHQDSADRHAHFDHDAGSAEIKKLSGAQHMVMDADVATVESGGAADPNYPTDRYPSVKVDRVLHDGDEVRLGDAVLIAHKTPGHTPGCTTWTMRTTQKGRPVNVVIVGSWNVNPGFRLVDRPGRPASYPGIAADYEQTFKVLKGLPCDVFLGAHGAYFNMLEKLNRANRGEGETVFLDPAGYRSAVQEREQAFKTELLRQEKGQ